MSNCENITTPEASLNITQAEPIENNILEMCVYGFNILVVFPTNFYTIWHIITRSGAASDAFLLSLSICSLIYSVYSLILFMTKWIAVPNIQAMTRFTMGFAITGSSLFQSLISAECYLAVVHPVAFLKYKPPRYRLICCAVAWTITLCSSAFCLFSFFFQARHVYMWFLSVQFLIFFSIKFFLCLGVLRALKHSGPADHRKHKEEENLTKRRAFEFSLIIAVITTITYLPFFITGIISAVTKNLFQIVWYICSVFFALASLIPPFIYLHRIEKLTCHSEHNA